MAFDGGFLHKMSTELKTALETHVDKIYQPSKDELVLLLRKKGFAKRLLINVKPGASRIQFTETRYENPQSPPMFCMLIRKYLSAAKLIDVFQPGTERVCELIFSSANEMGDLINIRLVAEFIGNKTNIILIGNDSRIIDSLRRSDPETSERMILPGAIYEYPTKQDKLNPLTTDTASICSAAVSHGGDPVKALLDTVDGFSPLICREICHKAMLSRETPIVSDKLVPALEQIISDLENHGKPILLIKDDGSPFDYSYTDISQYGETLEKRYFDNFSSLLDSFYSAKEAAFRIHTAAADIIKLVSNLKSRTEKKLALRKQELLKCEDREKLRIYGELLKANLYSIKPGATFAEVENYYDDLKVVRIPLDPSLSPSKNAAKYFKDYKKSYTAQQTLTELTKQDAVELVYFDSVLDSISRSTSPSDIKEIREELIKSSYIKSTTSYRKKTDIKPVLKEYKSPEGFRILVGKNNVQNDYITTTLASKNDLWFHVKNIPGSHVVIMCAGADVSDETVLFAAKLAAENSKASSSSQVPVDYTPIKYVKKPGGAKPGMVIYSTNKTLFVTP